MSFRLGAAIINGDHTRLGDELARLEAAGVDFVHWDVFDGRLIPDLGFGVRTIAQCRARCPLPFEVHLGALAPERFALDLKEAGCDRVLFHPEGARTAYESVFAFREQGLSVGIALALGTPLGVVGPLLPFIDAVLVLARVLGEGARGAGFHREALGRLRALKSESAGAGRPIELQVAGGVNRANLAEAARSGAGSAALGAGLYKVGDMRAEVAALRKAVGDGG